MKDVRIPPDAIRTGRRRIEELDYCELIKDLEWNNSEKKWILHCRIRIPLGSQFIPIETEWFVLIDEKYPWGTIEFYPGKKNGIEFTFQHQFYNGPGFDSGLPWRRGNICCKTPMHSLKRSEYDSEPIDPGERLLWNFQRARDWLQKASKDQLISPEDPFELPNFPIDINHKKVTVVFSEDATSMQLWNQIDEKSGIANLEEYESFPKHKFVKAFCSAKNKELYSPCLGNAFLEQAKYSDKCIWVRIGNLPVLTPWQVPVYWGELKRIFEKENMRLKDLISGLLKQFRDGKQHLLLLGFPIPKLFGGNFEKLHWQPLYMPVLSFKNEKGFRQNEKGYQSRDFSLVFTENQPLNWHHSENWNIEQISTRGKYPKSILELSILLIGAGALGSMFGELLVRSGINSLSIIDDDKLEIGNLVRHTLDITKIGESKAKALAKRLNLINPNSRVSAYDTSFSTEDENVKNEIQKCQLIIDCTANNFVISQLSDFQCESEKFFVSISIGMYARRLFIYLSSGCKVDSDSFHNSIKVWLDKEKEEFRDDELPWGGVGCWNPVFPARADDMWLMASVASKTLVSKIEQRIEHSQLMVFEQQIENNQFIGVKRVK